MIIPIKLTEEESQNEGIIKYSPTVTEKLLQ